MDFMKFPRAQAVLDIHSDTSVTAFSAVPGARWVLIGGVISWEALTASASLSLYEIDDANSSVLWHMITSQTYGYFHAYFGELGFQASSPNTRFMVNADAATGTFHCMFNGYYTGG